MDTTTVAVDLAKDVFEVATANQAHRIVDRRRLTRRQFEVFLTGLTAGTTVVMEACGTAHHWGRRCQERGLTVRLLPVQYVRPYGRRNKTDRTDVEGMLEAHRCAGIQPVHVKTVEPQALQALHRVRTQWQATRTARINVVRGLLREPGYPVPVGARTVVARVTAVLDDLTAALPSQLQQVLRALLAEISDLEGRVATVDRELSRLANTNATVARLQQVPGVGVVTATALVGAISHIHAFRRGRDFASWLGPDPARVDHRDASRSRPHQQTGRWLPAVSAHAWRQGRSTRRATHRPSTTAAADAPATMGRHAGGATGPQQDRHCPREQAGPHHLGRVVSRDRLSLTRRRAGGGVTEALPDELLSET